MSMKTKNEQRAACLKVNFVVPDIEEIDFGDPLVVVLVPVITWRENYHM
jgi:hypothetical protein